MGRITGGCFLVCGLFLSLACGLQAAGHHFKVRRVFFEKSDKKENSAEKETSAPKSRSWGADSLKKTSALPKNPWVNSFKDLRPTSLSAVSGAPIKKITAARTEPLPARAGRFSDFLTVKWDAEEGCEIRLPDVPLAMAVRGKFLFLAVPTDIGIAVQKNGAQKNKDANHLGPAKQKYLPPSVQSLPCVGGKLYRFLLAQDTFPVFDASDPRRIYVGRKKIKAHLPQAFLGSDCMMIASKRSLSFRKKTEGVVTYKNPLTHKKMFFFLKNQTDPALAAVIKQPCWHSIPAIKGVVLGSYDFSVTANAGGIFGSKSKNTDFLAASSDHFSPPMVSLNLAGPTGIEKVLSLPQVRTALKMWPTLEESLPKNSKMAGNEFFTTLGTLKRAVRYAEQGLFRSSLRCLENFEKRYAPAQEDFLYCAVKGSLLASMGRSSQALGLFARHPALWVLAAPLRAAAYNKNGDARQALMLTEQSLPFLTRFPNSVQVAALMAGAQSALVLGRQKKAQIFLSVLKKKTLNSRQKIRCAVLNDHAFGKRKGELSGASLDELDQNPDWQAYHARIRKKLRQILVRKELGKVDSQGALMQLKMVAQEGRGGQVEFQSLGEVARLAQAMGAHADALEAYARIMRYCPEADPQRASVQNQAEKLLMRTLFLKHLPDLKRCALLVRYAQFLPKNRAGNQALRTMTFLFVDMGLIDYVVPVLKARYDDNPGFFGDLILLCVRSYLKEGQGGKALAALQRFSVPKKLYQSWMQHKAYALAATGDYPEALDLLKDPPKTEEAARIAAPAYRKLGKTEEAIQALALIAKKTKAAFDVDRLAAFMARQDNLSGFQHFITKENIPVSPYAGTLLAAQKILKTDGLGAAFSGRDFQNNLGGLKRHLEETLKSF